MAADNRKGPWPRTQQHGTGLLPQTKHNNTPLTTVGLRTATQAGWLTDWLHSSGLTIKDSGEMEEGKKKREVEGMEKKSNRETLSTYEY